MVPTRFSMESTVPVKGGKVNDDDDENNTNTNNRAAGSRNYKLKSLAKCKSVD